MLLSVKETADRFNISERRVQKLCEEGRILGAQMISNVWLIPEEAEKPMDARTTPDIENMISLADLCKELSVSLATGKNWVKLGKLTPSCVVKRTPYFSLKYMTDLKTEIQNGDNKALKSRRNKKYVSGSYIYNSYVSPESQNLSILQQLFCFIEDNDIDITDEISLAIIADCATQFVLKRTENNDKGNIREYLNGKYKSNPYIYLIDDLLHENPFVYGTIDIFPELFNFRYTYENNEDILGLLYISLKNIGSRKATGSYYTPTAVVQKLCNKIFEPGFLSEKSVLDPCCGTGNFILHLPEEISYHNVYGNDIDAISARIARINYALKYLVFDKETIQTHITIGDYLKFGSDLKYDFIIGNPPWGYEYSDREKSLLVQKYRSANGSSIESYDIFVEQAINNLKQDGELAYILPEAVLNVKAHMQIRQVILENSSIRYIEYLGNAFDKVQCPCIILQLIHNGKPFSTVGLSIRTGSDEYTINTERTVSADFFSFNMTDNEYCLIDKIENVNNKATLAGNATFALGIVTGNNKEYISSEKTEENEMILKGSDIYKYRFTASSNFIVFKPESFQQIAPTEFYRAPEKLLYRFICNQLVFAYDNKQTLSLNSCNIVIPQIAGLSVKYVLAVLNSRIAQLYFKKKFNSVKVLRSHIEQIPIPRVNLEVQEQIEKCVDMILQASSEQEITESYEVIDVMISQLFELTEEEHQYIIDSMGRDNLFLF